MATNNMGEPVVVAKDSSSSSSSTMVTTTSNSNADIPTNNDSSTAMTMEDTDVAAETQVGASINNSSRTTTSTKLPPSITSSPVEEEEEEEEEGAKVGKRRKSKRSFNTPPKNYSERQLLKKAMEESRVDLEQQQVTKKQKKITHFFSSATTEDGTKHTISNNNNNNNNKNAKGKITKHAPKQQQQQQLDTTSHPEEEEEVAEKKDTTSTTNPSSNLWRTTGSQFIGQTCRRALTPQFYHLIPKSSYDIVNNVRLTDGIVVAWKETHGRTPTLYRIVYPSTNSSSSSTYYYEENVTTEELLSGIASASKRLNSSLTSEQFAKEQGKVQYYNKAMHRLVTDETHKVTLQILPHLIIAAMQELTLEKCIQNYIAEEEAMSGPTTTSSSDPSTSQPMYGKYFPFTQIYKSFFRSASSSSAAAAAVVNVEATATTTALATTSSSVSKRTHPSNSINNLTLSVSFAGSSIGNRIRQGATLAQDVFRRGAGSLDWLNIFEQGGRVASCIVRFCSAQQTSPDDPKVIDTYQLADAIKNIATKQIQSAVIEHLLYRPPSRKALKRKQEGEEEQEAEQKSQQPSDEPLSFHTPYQLICISGDVENEFSRARYSLLSIQKEEDTEEKETVEADDDQDLQEKRKVTDALQKQQQQVQQKLQKRITDLQSSDGFSTGLWSKWSDVAIACIKDRVSSVKSAFEQYNAKVEHETNGSVTQGTVLSSTSESQTLATDGSQILLDDEAMAKVLAEQQLESSNTAMQRPRRTRVKAEGMFYGSASGLTQIQLRDSLHRIIVQCCPSFLTFLEVKKILLNENESIGASSREMKKVYSALLKLLFDLGKVARFYVTNEAEYKISFGQRLVWNKQLCLPIKGSGDNFNNDQVLSPENEESEDLFKAFEAYLHGLFQTERALRTLVLLALQCSPKSVAGAADQDAETLQNAEEVDDKEESAHGTHHPWIGKCVLRPDGTKWRVVSFTPSKLLEVIEGGSTSATLTNISKDQSALPSNRIVKRRCRFQLVPWVGDFESDQSSQKDEELSGQGISLTEAQVNAGIDAVQLTMSLRRIRNFAIGNINHQNRHSLKKKLNTMLTLLVEEQSSHESCTAQKKYISGRIVGYDGNENQPCFLFLPRADDSRPEISSENRVLEDSDQTSLDVAAASMDFDSLLTSFSRDSLQAAVSESVEHQDDTPIPPSSQQDQAFWISLVDNETAFEFDPACLKLEGSSQEVVKGHIVSWLDFSHPSMVACKSILSWLKSQSKITPFLEKVDAVALKLFDYYDIVKNPMDLGTVEANLMQGRYSDANGNVNLELDSLITGDRPTFRGDLFLIFDNAVLYNAPDSWIHKSALWLKKNLLKRFDVEISKLEHSLGPSSKTTPSAQHEAYSYQVREDLVDDDEYVYSEDDDSSDDMLSSRKRKAKKAIDTGSTITVDVIEKSSSITEILGSKTFSSYLDNDSSTFSLPKDWLCRRLPTGQLSSIRNEDKTESKSNNSACALAHVLNQLMQTPSLQSQRRSTRASTMHSNVVNTTGTSNTELDGIIEYYLCSEPTVCGSNRTQVEMIREAMHEHYAEMYRDYINNAMAKLAESVSGKSSTPFNTEEGSAITESIDDTKISKFYNKDIFPPFLGNISLSTGKWEIRSHLVLPALLWVVRGMIHSGYLGCDDSTAANSPNSYTLLTLSNAYYWNKSSIFPFDVEEVAKKQQSKIVESESEEEEVELSEYEKARLERVARNQERLRQLGLA